MATASPVGRYIIKPPRAAKSRNRYHFARCAGTRAAFWRLRAYARDEENIMYSVGWGNQLGVFADRRETACEALALAEELEAAHRRPVVVTDLATERPVLLGELRERAEREAARESATRDDTIPLQ
jgi:hypothetical protein